MAATGQATRRPDRPASAPLPPAGLQLRIVAFILDCIVVFSFAMSFFAVGGAFVLLFAENSDYALPIMGGAAAFALFPFAPLLFAFLWSWRGQSIGMMAVRIVVTDTRGRRPSFARALFRTLVWPLSFVPLGIGLITMLLGRERRALHDLLAGTVVRELP